MISAESNPYSELAGDMAVLLEKIDFNATVNLDDVTRWNYIKLRLNRLEVMQTNRVMIRDGNEYTIGCFAELLLDCYTVSNGNCRGLIPSMYDLLVARPLVVHAALTVDQSLERVLYWADARSTELGYQIQEYTPDITGILENMRKTK